MTQDAFDELVSEVFQRFMSTFLKYDFEKYDILSEAKNDFDNVIFISMFGDIEGGFILEVDDETVEKLIDSVRKVLHEQFDLTELIKGYMGEFGNILASKIVTKMGKNFGSTHLSTPSLFTGTGMSVDLFYDKSFRSIIDTDFGIFKISFSVKNS